MPDTRLAGTRIGVTAARKGRQLADALERRGAETIHAPLLRADRRADDAAVMAQTDTLVAAEPAWFAASTRKGMQLWRDACERHGRIEEVTATLRAARRAARSPKAVAGLGLWGLEPEFVATSETDAEVARWLIEHIDDGDVVGVQRHGLLTGAFEELIARTEVVTVAPYRADPPDDTGPAEELIAEICAGDVDAVAFTSRTAGDNLFAVAEQLGGTTGAEVTDALTGTTAVAAIGPVTGQVFDRRGIPIAVMPERHKTGALIDALCDWADGRA